MVLNEKDIRKYCKDKPRVILTIATHEKGIDEIRSFGNNGAPVTPETRSYEIGSISKVVLSTLLAKCLEEGLLSLNDTIDRYIDLPPECSYPTILQLATHTSSYADPDLFDSKLAALSWSFSSSKKQFNPFARFGSNWLIDSIVKASRKPRKTEGRFRYSNFGYSVLGRTLGEAMNSAYYDYITSYIREDLGLSSTSCNSNEFPMVHGFKKDNDLGNWIWLDDSAYAPAGCICSTAADMLAFAKMNLYDEKSYLTYSHQKRASDKHLDVGLGWILEKDDDIIWHNGETGLFHAVLAFSKKRERAVVVLSNCITSMLMPEDALALSIIKGE
ncbi:serine hydrolase domain-containing protein [Raoultibacter phocaeensis]|uniref:serine hydrolase domain-containing protein n=1 Tax=Raoultibacter phocaeensis TaxID=2479841 RepID=UPI0011187983|nr:serine hydrolase domain-containing protein [Raoultibacter phocaeensis]